MNQVSLIGHIGQDPELRYTESGTPVGNFSIAVNRVWTNSEGEKQEETDWFKIVVFGGSAENCEKYLHSGSKVAVSGRLSQNKWEDDDGNNRTSIEIVAFSVEFLDNFGSSDGGEGGDQDSYDDEDLPF